MAKPVSREIYDKEYFLKHRGGSSEFLRSKGKELYETHKFALKIADLNADDVVLDLGCGCGEVALNAAPLVKSVLAVDYSEAAIELALDAKKYFNAEVQEKVTFVNLDFSRYSFPDNFFDAVFLLDVIEHLTPHHTLLVLSGIHKSLKASGRLIVHTWPNRWHRQLTYPIAYYIGKISGKPRPRDPRTLHEKLMHVNEQSPHKLRINLKEAGFDPEIFLRHHKTGTDSIRHLFYDLIHSVSPFKWVFCDQIWAIGRKDHL
ncbi:MAG: class I SAM-dependent methyltransferase [Deltaproteobacteria bacterium]|nr:MAG: class I SAM-dependent methyltransferase [Deltaproteobacteria bacterium]